MLWCSLDFPVWAYLACCLLLLVGRSPSWDPTTRSLSKAQSKLLALIPRPPDGRCPLYWGKSELYNSFNHLYRKRGNDITITTALRTRRIRSSARVSQAFNTKMKKDTRLHYILKAYIYIFSLAKTTGAIMNKQKTANDGPRRPDTTNLYRKESEPHIKASTTAIQNAG